MTASTKFEIDIADAAACESGLKAVFEAMEQLHGARLAGQILTRALRDEAVRGACLGIKPAHLGLLLAYYQMPKPSKRALAAKLARINGNSNPPAYGTTGSDKASVLLRQIQRAFTQHAARLPALAALDHKQREDALAGARQGVRVRWRRRKERRRFQP